MSKYSTIHASNGFAEGTILKNDSGKYFGGYDFMGSVNWLETTYDAVLMDDDEAEQIISDLEAADEPDEPDLPGKMMAIMSSVRADDPSCEYHEFTRKTMTEYTSWLLRAAARGYEIYREEPDHLVVYLSSQTHKNVSFQIAFRQC